MDRAAKRELVSTLSVQFKNTGSVVVAGYQGLTVAEMNALRGKVRAAGGTVKVAKNRLAKLALQGTELEPIAGLFKGPTVIVQATDPVAGPKVAVEFAKTNDKFVVLGGALGNQMLDANGVKALSELPSLDALRGKILGLLNAPATKIAGVLQAPGGQLARVMAAYAKKDEAA